MAENYSLNSKFGYNVSPSKTKINAPKIPVKEIQENIGNLFDTMTGYVQKYENVFSGDVEKEINMYLLINFLENSAIKTLLMFL